jgi:hypothetical protein
MKETPRRRRTVTSSLHGISTGKRKEGAESIARIPPFGPIEGQKWFDLI